MKLIEFNAKHASSNCTMLDVKEAVQLFLINHSGSPATRSFVSLSSMKDYIIITANCSNSDFTRALALLQLIFSDDTSPAFVSYRKECSFLIEPKCDRLNEIVDYINAHMFVKIHS